MKNKGIMIELATNLMLFAIALALIIQTMIKTTTINYHNTIKVQALAHLNSITAIIDTNPKAFDDYYQITDNRIYFDQNNHKTTENYYYYIEISSSLLHYQFRVCDRLDNELISLDYEVAYAK